MESATIPPLRGSSCVCLRIKPCSFTSCALELHASGIESLGAESGRAGSS